MSPYADQAGLNPDRSTITVNGDEDCFALFGYIPVRFANSDDEQYVNRLVLDFKEAKAPAVDAVINLATQHLFELDVSTVVVDVEDLLGIGAEVFYGTAIAAPSSKVGAGSPAINQLINALTSPHRKDPHYPDVKFILAGDEVLLRHTALETPSHKQKKSMSDHLQTIRLEKKAGIRLEHPPRTDRYVIFDDVYTRGETFGACKALIRAAHPGAEVRGFFVAHTWAQNK
jgi:hypothetical protein